MTIRRKVIYKTTFFSDFRAASQNHTQFPTPTAQAIICAGSAQREFGAGITGKPD